MGYGRREFAHSRQPGHARKFQLGFSQPGLSLLSFAYITDETGEHPMPVTVQISEDTST